MITALRIGAAVTAWACLGGVVTPARAQAPAGADVYRLCANCHMANGEGLTGAYPPLAKSEYVTGRAETLVAIILAGLEGPVTVRGRTYDSAMPPWKNVLSDDEVAAVATYVRRSFGNRAAPVTAATVRAVRAQVADRIRPLRVEDLPTVSNPAPR
jgi:mono/diheme cytochrome c family protein